MPFSAGPAVEINPDFYPYSYGRDISTSQWVESLILQYITLHSASTSESESASEYASELLIDTRSVYGVSIIPSSSF
jgi:hypothetical protein